MTYRFRGPDGSEQAIVLDGRGDDAACRSAIAADLHASMPVSVIRYCGAEGSLNRSTLPEKFDLQHAPARNEGEALDWVFLTTTADWVLILQAGVELRDGRLVDWMREAKSVDYSYGAGFVHGGSWIEDPGHPAKVAVRHVAPWMGCVFLRADHMRRALDAGVSFGATTIFNDVRWSPRLSRLLATRFTGLSSVPRYPVFERMLKAARWSEKPLDWLRWARGDFYSLRPNYVVADCGALIDRWSRRDGRSSSFYGRPLELRSDAEVTVR